MPSATSRTADGTAVARRPRARRALALLARRPGAAGRPRSASPVRRGRPSGSCSARATTPATTAGYPNAGYKAHASTSYWRQSTGHNCTNYVAYRLVTNGLANTRPATLSGNAYNWGSAFPSQTNDAPAVGSVAWWGQSFSGTGHVAYVEKVVSADEIIVSEDNWGGDFRWRTITRSGGCGRPASSTSRTMGPQVAAPASYPPTGPVPPTRIVDTRSGLGATAARSRAGSATSILVNGKAGLPETAVGAVVAQRDGGSSPGGRLAT